MCNACVIRKLEDDLGDFEALSVRVIQIEDRENSWSSINQTISSRKS